MVENDVLSDTMSDDIDLGIDLDLESDYDSGLETPAYDGDYYDDGLDFSEQDLNFDDLDDGFSLSEFIENNPYVVYGASAVGILALIGGGVLFLNRNNNDDVDDKPRYLVAQGISVQDSSSDLLDEGVGNIKPPSSSDWNSANPSATPIPTVSASLPPVVTASPSPSASATLAPIVTATPTPSITPSAPSSPSPVPTVTVTSTVSAPPNYGGQQVASNSGTGGGVTTVFYPVPQPQPQPQPQPVPVPPPVPPKPSMTPTPFSGDVNVVSNKVANENVAIPSPTVISPLGLDASKDKVEGLKNLYSPVPFDKSNPKNSSILFVGSGVKDKFIPVPMPPSDEVKNNLGLCDVVSNVSSSGKQVIDEGNWLPLICEVKTDG